MEKREPEAMVKIDEAPGLAWLEDHVQREIALLRHNYQPWVPPALDVDGEPVRLVEYTESREGVGDAPH